MKTTLIVNDNLYRRAKARAAMEGISLSRFLEESLEKALKEEETDPLSLSRWFDSLPDLPPEAIKELNQVFEAADFREIEEEMWQ